MPKRRMRSEFAGIDSPTGVPVNPMKPASSVSRLPAHINMRLTNQTGYPSTIMPLNRRAWLGFDQFPPIPIPSRIPKQ
jgi:hypothetical protein